jgi:hypothetical protein
MVDLAGFDVIVEFHKDTIIDWVNYFPVPDPSGEGDIRLLGGPFSVELPLVIPGVGATQLYLILEMTVEPVVHQPILRLAVTIRSGTCTFAGRGIDHIGGSLALDIPLLFQIAPSQTAPGPWRLVAQTWQIVAQMPLAQVTAFQFDAVTQKKLKGTLNPADVITFTNVVLQAIRQLAGPSRSWPAPLFKVVPGVDSADPLQLSSVPVIAWIDAFTFGVFGYYSSKTAGSITAKKGGDLYQANDEFMYGLPGTEPMRASRRMAFLMSATAAHQVFLCPLIREGVVRPLRIKQEAVHLAEEIFSDKYQDLFHDQMGLHFADYFNEELAKNDPSLQGMWGANDADKQRAKAEHARSRAEARVQGDVLALIDTTTKTLASLWGETLGASDAIAAAVPPPCGAGSVEAFRQHVNELSVQSEFITGILRKFDLMLDVGRLVAHYEADAFIEDVLGDVTPKVEGDIEIKLDVNEWGAIFAHLNVLTPHPSVEATGFSATLIAILQGFVPGIWQFMLIYAGILLQQKLESTIRDSLNAQNPSPLSLQKPIPPQAGKPTGSGLEIPLPSNLALQQAAYDAIDRNVSSKAPTAAAAAQAAVMMVRMKDVQITKDSIALFALVARDPNYNFFNPRISLSVQKSLTSSGEPSIEGFLHLPKTDWGCREATFSTPRVFWNTEIRVNARHHDLTMPLSNIKWNIEIGNFTVSSIGRFTVADPRPRWSGAPASLRNAVLHLSGVVNHPDSPLTRVDGPPFPLGHLISKTDIEAVVAGDDASGWSIGFQGRDGNFYVKLTLDAIDGDNIPRHGEAIVIVKGDELQLPAEYIVYKSTCDAKYKAYSRLHAALAPPMRERMKVSPGEDVSHLQDAAQEIHKLIEAGDPIAIDRLETFHRQHGQDALRALPSIRGGAFPIKS